MNKNIVSELISVMIFLAITGNILLILAILDIDYFYDPKTLIIIIICFIITKFYQQDFIKIRLNLFISLFSFCIMIIISDLILRSILKPNLYYRPHEMFGNSMPEYNKLLARYDKLVKYEGVSYGDLAARSGQLKYKEPRIVKFQTDSLGFRNIVGQKNKKNEIIILGDSFAVGTGTNQDSSFAGLLLQHKEIYNLAYPGNPIQELANLTIHLDDICLTKNPTVLWFLFTGNDQSSSLGNNTSFFLNLINNNKIIQYGYDSNPIFKFAVRLKSFFRRSSIRQLLLKVKRKNNTKVLVKDFINRKKMLFYGDYIHASTLSEIAITKQPKMKQMKALFSTAKKFVNQHNLDLKVILIPTKYEIYSSFYQEKNKWEKVKIKSGFSIALTSLFEELEIDFYDSSPYLLDYAEKVFYENAEAIWWLDDTHFNTTGHKGMYELVKKILEEENLK